MLLIFSLLGTTKNSYLYLTQKSKKISRFATVFLIILLIDTII